MKKILSILMLVAVLATSLMVFPVAAENYDTVYKATPTFDGKLDNVYKSSLACVMNESFWSGADYIMGPNGSEYKGDYFDPNFTATSYFLHDDEYVYVCVYVQDANIIDAPASTKKDPSNFIPVAPPDRFACPPLFRYRSRFQIFPVPSGRKTAVFSEKIA